METEIDSVSGLSVRSTASGAAGRRISVEHSYLDTGDLIVRTKTVTTASGSRGSHVVTLTLSHVVIDGKEIIK